VVDAQRKMNVLKIYTDGSGSSGHSCGSASAVFLDDNDDIDYILVRDFTKDMTCNEAEYSAVLLALEERKHGEKIKIFSDSQLVVNQLKPENPWKINFEHLKLLNSLVRDVIDNFELDIDIEWIPRDENLAGQFLEGKLRIPEDKIIEVD
jgi:ribonuclease HI